MISNEQREDIALNILLCLDQLHPQGLTAKGLMVPLKRSGLTLLEIADVESLLSDLEEKQLVKPVESKLAAEVKRYLRTDAGRVLLRQSGF